MHDDGLVIPRLCAWLSRDYAESAVPILAPPSFAARLLSTALLKFAIDFADDFGTGRGAPPPTRSRHAHRRLIREATGPQTTFPPS